MRDRAGSAKEERAGSRSNEAKGREALPLSPKSTVSATLLLLLGLAGCTSESGTQARVLSPVALAYPPNPVLPVTVASLPQDRPAYAAPGTSSETVTATVATAYAAPEPASKIEAVFAPEGRFGPQAVAARSPELDQLISRYSVHYEVPESLVRRVVNRESTFDPSARNGPYWGLMQILPATARSMGYQGPNEGLLDAETNLKYAVRYLRGAWLTAGGDEDQAVRFYARGYYFDAKAKGLLDETGLGRDRHRMR